MERTSNKVLKESANEAEKEPRDWSPTGSVKKHFWGRRERSTISNAGDGSSED